MTFEIRHLTIILMLVAAGHSLCTQTNDCPTTHQCNSYGFCVVIKENVQ